MNTAGCIVFLKTTGYIFDLLSLLRPLQTSGDFGPTLIWDLKLQWRVKAIEIKLNLQYSNNSQTQCVSDVSDLVLACSIPSWQMNYDFSHAWSSSIGIRTHAASTCVHLSQSNTTTMCLLEIIIAVVGDRTIMLGGKHFAELSHAVETKQHGILRMHACMVRWRCVP